MTLTDAITKAAKFATEAAVVTTKPDIAVVWHEQRGEWAYYNADAWEPSQGLLPWQPPPYPAVAFVAPDGSWTKGPGYANIG